MIYAINQVSSKETTTKKKETNREYDVVHCILIHIASGNFEWSNSIPKYRILDIVS